MSVLQIVISAGDSVDSNFWWKELLLFFAHPGEYFEIHCWKNGIGEIETAKQFGEIACFQLPNFIIINGIINEKIIHFFKNVDKPEKYSGYNKMVPFYTLHIGGFFFSEDYGTRMILKPESSKDKIEIQKKNQKAKRQRQKRLVTR